MTRALGTRLGRLERARNADARFVMWEESDQPGAPLVRVDLCGLSHEECLDILLEEPEAPHMGASGW